MTEVLAQSTSADVPGSDAAAAGHADEGAHRRGVSRNLAALTTGQLFTWTMTLAWTVVVPRWLGPGQMGIIFAAISITGILQVLLGAGTGIYVTREIVAASERGPVLVATAVLARLALLPIFMGAVILWAGLAHYGSEARWVLYLSGAATAIYLLAEPLQSYLQAREEMQYLALSNAINKSGQGLGGIVVTVLGFRALGFAGCWTVMSALVLLLCFRWVQRSTKITLRTTRRALADIARGSAAYWTAGVFFMVYLWIDTAMLSVMTHPAVVAWYGVPTKLFQTMLFVPGLLTTAWLPKLVRAFQESPEQLYAAARVPVTLTLAAALPICALIAVAAPAITIVYGSKYGNAVPVLIILGGALVPMYLNIMLNQVCVAAGRQRDWTWLMVGATIFNPAVNAVLIPLSQHQWGNGAIGAAIALALTEIVIAAAAVAIVGRHVIRRAVLARTLRSALASGLAVLASLAAREWSGRDASVAAGVLTLPVLLVVCGAISRGELNSIRGRASAVVARLPFFSRALTRSARP